jgi:RNA polymerase sigma-70 factor (ECF subfamily)
MATFPMMDGHPEASMGAHLGAASKMSQAPPKTWDSGSREWERAIIARFHQGEVEAFEELVLHYQDRLYNAVFWMSSDESETRDVLQETFLQAFRSLKNFRGEAAIGTWLYRIAANTFMKGRSRSRLTCMDDLDLENLALSRMEKLRLVPPSPEEALVEKEGRTLLGQAIAKLPEEYRVVLVLRDVEGRAAAEVAEILDLSVAAVKSRLHRARLFVRRQMEKYASA